MIVRSLDGVAQTEHFVDYGNGTSHRLLTSADEMGFTACHTVVNACTESHSQYSDHSEACYCIARSGGIGVADGTVYPIKVGTIYALDKHDRHFMRAHEGAGMVLVSVFNPPLSGTEVHDLTSDGASGY